MHWRMAIRFATGTHLKLHLLDDTRTEKKYVRSNSCRLQVLIEGRAGNPWRTLPTTRICVFSTEEKTCTAVPYASADTTKSPTSLAHRHGHCCHGPNVNIHCLSCPCHRWWRFPCQCLSDGFENQRRNEASTSSPVVWYSFRWINYQCIETDRSQAVKQVPMPSRREIKTIGW